MSGIVSDGSAPSSELEVAYAQRRRQVDTYASTWWTLPQEPQKSFLDTHPGVRPTLMLRLLSGQQVATYDVYAESAAGPWAPERQRVHNDLLLNLDALDRAPATTAGRATDSRRAVYFLIGLPGSGKSTNLRPLALAHASTRIGTTELTDMPVSDADAVRAALPEYAGGLGSGIVQVETAQVTYGEAPHLHSDGRQDRILARAGSVLIDVIGDPDFLPATVTALRAQGRDCYVLLADCDPAECRRRVMQRALGNGRFVPVELVDAKVGVPDSALEAAIATGELSGWGRIDTEHRPGHVLDGDGTFT